jgi:hypothetical protein
VKGYWWQKKALWVIWFMITKNVFERTTIERPETMQLPEKNTDVHILSSAIIAAGVLITISNRDRQAWCSFKIPLLFSQWQFRHPF